MLPRPHLSDPAALALSRLCGGLLFLESLLIFWMNLSVVLIPPLVISLYGPARQDLGFPLVSILLGLLGIIAGIRVLARRRHSWASAAKACWLIVAVSVAEYWLVGWLQHHGWPRQRLLSELLSSFGAMAVVFLAPNVCLAWCFTRPSVKSALEQVRQR